MPDLYVMFSHTNTGMGRMIRAVTGSSYNHVSISLRPDLAVCYSFARRNKHNALAGGFVAEDAGRLCDEGDIRVRVCRVPVTRRQFDAARNMLMVCRAQPGRIVAAANPDHCDLVPNFRVFEVCAGHIGQRA